MAAFCEIADRGVIAFTGPDAISFLQGQLTSDVAGLPPSSTQYSGYCTPKGRLLATFLLWRLEDEVLFVIPAELREPIQTRISKYVLRARVKVADASSRYAIFAIAGDGAAAVLTAALGSVPAAAHESSAVEGAIVTALPIDRYLVLVPRDKAHALRQALAAQAELRDESLWSKLDIEAGVPMISLRTQEQYVPQMVNLDLIGAVSYGKGCYPGQEIVARTHYLGRVKQRTYRIRTPEGVQPAIGDRLYSDEYGAEQASGAILNTAPESREALAVLYTSSVARGVHHAALNGPAIEVLPLPYELNDQND